MQRVAIFCDRDIGKLEEEINASIQSNEYITTITHSVENNYHTVIVVFEKYEI